MASVGEIVFDRSQSYNDDMWDDTALIKAYDKAVRGSKQNSDTESVSKISRNGRSKKPEGVGKVECPVHQNGVLGWNVGDSCKAVYTEDDLLYDAVVVKIVDEQRCIVRYQDYLNEEEQYFDDLLPLLETPSEQSSDRSKHTRVSKKKPPVPNQPAGMTHQHHHQVHPPGVPPLPMISHPPLPALPNLDEQHKRSLDAMLKSWYWTGYHTGYYQALSEMGKSGSK